MLPPQDVRDPIGFMLNRVLMESPRFSPQRVRDPVESMQNHVHGISLFVAHRKYVIPLDQC